MGANICAQLVLIMLIGFGPCTAFSTLLFQKEVSMGHLSNVKKMENV
mgnify:CR=1 FL=1